MKYNHFTVWLGCTSYYMPCVISFELFTIMSSQIGMMNKSILTSEGRFHIKPFCENFAKAGLPSWSDPIPRKCVISLELFTITSSMAAGTYKGRHPQKLLSTWSKFTAHNSKKF